MHQIVQSKPPAESVEVKEEKANKSDDDEDDEEEKPKKNEENVQQEPKKVKPQKKTEDYIYFVLSGEFAATQVQRIINQGMDNSEFESKNNRDYMQVQKECFLK